MRHGTAQQSDSGDARRPLRGLARRGLLRHGSQRRGVATVELAACVPVIVLLTFGAIEMSNAIFLKQALRTAAYEAARVATTSGQNEADARARTEQVLNARGIENYAIAFSPAVTFSLPRGTEVTATVSAPISENRIGPQWFFTNETLRSTVIMIRN